MLLLSKVTLKSSCPKTGPEVGSFSAAACLWFSLTLTLKGFSPNAFLMLKRNAEFEDIALVPSGPKGRIKVIISLISVISSVTLLYLLYNSYDVSGGETGPGYTNNPLIDIFLYSHDLSV